MFRCYTSPRPSFSRATLSSAASSASFAQTNSEISDADSKIENGEIGFELNRIDSLVRVLHESARSFSLAVESLKLSGTGPELAMAWVGKDVHGWHKRISYLVELYRLYSLVAMLVSFVSPTLSLQERIFLHMVAVPEVSIEQVVKMNSN